MPLQHRHGYAAGLHRGLPAGDITQPRSSPPDRRRAGARCYPAQIRQVRAGGLLLRGVQPLVPHVRLSVSLAGPGPSGSAGPSRRCQGCCPPSPSSQGSGCPQLQRPAATSRRRCPFTTARFESASWRSMSASHNAVGLIPDEVPVDQIVAGWACGSRIVVRTRRRPQRPLMPWTAISRSTRLWLTRRPGLCSLPTTRGQP